MNPKLIPGLALVLSSNSLGGREEMNYAQTRHAFRDKLRFHDHEYIHLFQVRQRVAGELLSRVPANHQSPAPGDASRRAVARPR